MFILKCWLELAASLSLFYLILGILFSVLCHMAQTKVKTDYMGPLARWRRTCLFDVTCEHARKSVWSSICYIPLWSDNIKRFSQLGVPSELSSWFGWILGFLLHSRLDFVSVLQLISSNALIWTRPDHFGGVGWNRFLAVLSIWFHMLWTTSILSRPVGLSRRERKRGRVDTQSQRVPSYSFSFSSHLALSGLLPRLPCLCLTLVAWPVPGSHLRTRVSQIPIGAYCPPTPSNQISPGKQEEFCSIQIRYQAWTNLATKSAQRAVL